MIEFLNRIDTQLFLFFNSFHSESWDSIMLFVSGKYSWIPLYIFILFLIIKKFKTQSWVIILSVILIITLCDQVSVHLFKNVFERLRPCHNPAIQHLVHTVNNSCGGQYGFVSSHAANTFGLAVFSLLILRNKYYTIFILFWATLVSYSRIYLGRHYPGDVMAGAVIGSAIAFGINQFYVYFVIKTTSHKSHSISRHSQTS